MIGIFDSGSGGLSVLARLRERLPSADVLYFGDLAHAPYGSRSRDELTTFTLDAVSFLRSKGATSLISACNSVSASLALSLTDALDAEAFHLIEMVGPTVSALKRTDARIVVAATQATIDSSIYQHAFRLVGREVSCVALPQLAGAIELGAPPEEITGIIRDGLAHAALSPGDILLLACTHYPLVLSIFQSVVGPRVSVYDPALAVAERAEVRLRPRESGNGTTRFYISKDSPVFRSFVARLFPETEYAIEVV